jgi:gliding motility-associated-like protein
VDQGDAVVLQAQVQPTGTMLSQIRWSPPNYFSLPVSLTETVKVLETTLFQLEIEDPNGCSASDTIRVQVRRDAIYVPNIFHPGSQDNDQFTVFGAADIQEVTLMRVYDRWGSLLFEKRHFPPNDPSQGWDGNYRGQAMPPGVYIYYLELVTVEGRALELKGNVTVLR